MITNSEKYIESFRMKHEAFLAGCDSIEEMGVWDTETLGEMDVYYSNNLANIIIRLIAVDGNITSREVEYLNKTFELDYTLDELIEVYNICQDDIGQSFDENFENGITYMRKINSKLADAYKELLVLVCEIITESDGVVSESEAEEVRRLKALCE